MVLENITEENNSKESLETPSTILNLNAPKHGTIIPNRVFVGGIAPATTEMDLIHLFSSYGNVTGTKIISDRAGVSKGYGFVTFETEDEAKRLQKDAENIVLGQRRLNIAPAIKKQGFSRGNFDCSTNSPLPPTQLYRHNGFTYAFHNGMAFFQQPSPTVPTSPHVEPSPVFQTGSSYGAVAPSSPAGPAYPFPFAPQGQIFYQTPQYQYHLPQFDGCYDAGQMMVTDGSLVIPQYYLAPQPPPELAFYPPTLHNPETTAPIQQVIYTSPRAYDSSLMYSTEPKCGMESSVGAHSGVSMAVVSKEEGEPPTSNHQRRPRESSTPVVSLLKLYKGKDDHSKKKQHNTHDEGRRQYYLNNNNPDTTNRNLKHQESSRHGNLPSLPSYPPVHTSPNLKHPTVQVPQFPFYSRQVLAPPATLASFYPPPIPHSRPRSNYRPRYGGGRGGGRGSGNKWLPKEEEMGQPLTPPITPRSEPSGVTGATTGPEDVVQSIQALAI